MGDLKGEKETLQKREGLDNLTSNDKELKKTKMNTPQVKGPHEKGLQGMESGQAGLFWSMGVQGK